MNLSDLHKPFPPEAVSWRVGSMTKDKSKGLALAYIDARDVMARLDEVCGPANWQAAYPHANGKTICSIGIKIGDEWVWKANGAGDTDIEAEKGAISDAFKRAAVLWGIGRYLYDVKSPWVELDEYKAIKPGEMAKLDRVLRGGQPAPSTVKPEAAKPKRASDAEITEYCTAFNKQVKLCKNRLDVEKAWKNGIARREQLGIALGDDDYTRLAGFCKDRIEEFESPQESAA